ncbi:Coatomer subunit beta (CopB) [Blattamonas nauphoetae]|uniref:Coatomer subunit beta n=1 Tax=Blattamonas nauphoetae TaxID=2049346 RepID=A0ABQ9Y9P6_9EUKA|nr:Coatomer subunit beta (CopB) [Blattamonas nauphoetae]
MVDALISTVASFLDTSEKQTLQVESSETILRLLESKAPANKIQALKSLILLYNSEEKSTTQKMLMNIIRTCVNVNDNILKKYLLQYYEITGLGKEECDPQRRAMFLLVCNSFMKDLEGPNEYLCGATLHFLTTVTDQEILTQVLPCILKTAQHSHFYVRRYSVLCISKIHQHHPDMVPDAPELIAQVLQTDSDPIVIRNCLQMLFETSPEHVLEYLEDKEEAVAQWPPSLQLTLLELIKKRCKTKAQEKSYWLRFVHAMMSSARLSVKFECARTLLTLSVRKKDIETVISCYNTLLSSVTENCVKLAIYDALIALKKKYAEHLSAHLPLSTLFLSDTQSTQLQKKRLNLILSLLTPTNANELLPLLIKEARKLLAEAKHAKGNQDSQETIADNAECRLLTLETLRRITILIPPHTTSICATLVQYADDPSEECSRSAMQMLRELTSKSVHSKGDIITDVILPYLPQCTTPSSMLTLLWIVGEFSESTLVIEAALAQLYEMLAPLPLTSQPIASTSDQYSFSGSTPSQNPSYLGFGGTPSVRGEGMTNAPSLSAASGPRIMEDGGYAPVHVVNGQVDSTGEADNDMKGIRRCIVNGDQQIGVVLSETITKLVLRMDEKAKAEKGADAEDERQYDLMVSGLSILLAVLSFFSTNAKNNKAEGIFVSNKTESSGPHIDESLTERINECINAVMSTQTDTTTTHPFLLRTTPFADQLVSAPVVTKTTITAIESVRIIEQQERTLSSNRKKQGDPLSLFTDSKTIPVPPINVRGGLDRKIAIRAIEKDVETDDRDDEDEIDLYEQSRGERGVEQLSGLSDQVYVEAVVTARHVRVNVDLICINRTGLLIPEMTIEFLPLSGTESNSSNNVSISFSLPPNPTPVTHSLTFTPPSTGDIGGVQGYVSYRLSKSRRDMIGEERFMTLFPLSFSSLCSAVPVVDPPSIDDIRRVWNELPWEVRVNLKTKSVKNLTQLLYAVAEATNMQLLPYGRPMKRKGGKGKGASRFVSALFYSRTRLGRDVIMHISAEEKAEGGEGIVGWVRIRASDKTTPQLGKEKINAIQ